MITIVQKLSFGKLSGSGIVVVLIIAGIAMNAFGIESGWSNLALGAGVLIAITLGALGIVGVVKRLT